MQIGEFKVSEIFEAGQSVTLNQILENKEWRVYQQNKLEQQFPNKTIVSVKLNIPGEIKQSPAIELIFKTGVNILDRVYDDVTLAKESYITRITGPETFYVIDASLRDTKTLAIEFEEASELGRLFDVDVMSTEDQGHQLSRTELGFDVRRCFVCGEPAKVCARTQKHAKAEMIDTLNTLYDEIEASN